MTYRDGQRVEIKNFGKGGSILDGSRAVVLATFQDGNMGACLLLLIVDGPCAMQYKQLYERCVSPVCNPDGGVDMPEDRVMIYRSIALRDMRADGRLAARLMKQYKIVDTRRPY